MGKWLTEFLTAAGQEVKFTSGDHLSQYDDNASLVADSDAVILAVPISAMEAVLEEVFPLLDGKLLIDVCSVKSGIVNRFESLAGQHPAVSCRYLPLHPMFAPSAATTKGQVVIFNDGTNINQDEINWWRRLFTEQGALIQDISSREHDELMGLIQGLNHFNVFVSAKTLAHMGAKLDFIKTLSSPSYRIFMLFYTRYVLQNPRLYAEIQIFNPYVKEVTRRFMKEAEKLLSIIEGKDFEGFENYVRDIQPFFERNRSDSELSDKLIEALGQLLSDTPLKNASADEPVNQPSSSK